MMRKIITPLVLLSLTSGLSFGATFTATDVDSWSVLTTSAGLTDGMTSSPLFGDVTAGSNDTTNSLFGGTWGSATVDVGETFIATGSFQLTDSTLGSTSGFRIALVNQSSATAFQATGGFLYYTNNNLSPTDERLRTARTVPSGGNFGSVAGNSQALTNDSLTTSGQWLTDTEYTFEFSVERTALTEAALSMTITGGSLSIVQTATDSAATADDFTLDNVGFFFDSSSQIDAVQLANIQVSVVPEPSAAALFAGFVGLTMIMVRRR